MTTSEQAAVAPVRKSITVRASVERAFDVFTADIDSWWPRSHHIGKSPMKKILIEPKAGGRYYSQQEDGTECDNGTVLVWEPPHRIVVSWQINPDWTFQPDLALSSEFEVRFTKVDEGTRVDLEHRHFERHGAGGASMGAAVGSSEGGWGGMLQLFADRANQA